MNPLVRVQRKVFSLNSTIGELTFQDFGCWTLEPSERKNPSGLMCIPAGTYKIEWRWSNAHGIYLPGLLDVPGFSDIEIHAGNFEGSADQNGIVKFDSKGCLILGETHGTDYVSNSVKTCNEFYPLVQEALKAGDLFIGISG